MTEKDCFRKGLLKKTIKQPGLAKKDLSQAEFFLNECEDLVGLSKKHMAVIALYNSYFHLARSLLIKDGIKERSHYCIARYIEENYDFSEFLDAFETIMSLRHTVQYSAEKVDLDVDLVYFINLAYGFLESFHKYF
ncbi:MAG: HEPN domain-containing protein [Nanobdellota archaeon]